MNVFGITKKRCMLKEGRFKVDSDKFWQKMDEDVRDLLKDGIGKNRYMIEDCVAMKHSFWIIIVKLGSIRSDAKLN